MFLFGQIDASFKVWVLPSSREKGSATDELPVLGWDDPSVRLQIKALTLVLCLLRSCVSNHPKIVHFLRIRHWYDSIFGESNKET